MKEQILKILKKYENLECVYNFTQDTKEKAEINLASSDSIAEEITAHITEFIMWLEFGSHPFVAWWDIEDGKKVKYFTDEVSQKRHSLEELYQYWLTNFNNIEK